jgi:hypothetical protein
MGHKKSRVKIKLNEPRHLLIKRSGWTNQVLTGSRTRPQCALIALFTLMTNWRATIDKEAAAAARAG